MWGSTPGKPSNLCVSAAGRNLCIKLIGYLRSILRCRNVPSTFKKTVKGRSVLRVTDTRGTQARRNESEKSPHTVGVKCRWITQLALLQGKEARPTESSATIYGPCALC